MRLVPIVLLAAALAAQQPQPETPVFRAGAADVKVDALVLDGQRIVAGLAQDDFTVYDEAEPQKIVYFAHETEPLSLLLVLDVSGSMHRWLEAMAAKSREALRNL